MHFFEKRFQLYMLLAYIYFLKHTILKYVMAYHYKCYGRNTVHQDNYDTKHYK